MSRDDSSTIRPKKKPGRKRKFTKEIGELIVSYVKAGNYIETAAAAAGIAKDTLYRWLRDGRRGDPMYTEFCEQMDEAVAIAEVAGVTVIQQAARDGAWQAAAWHLERKYSHRWGRDPDQALRTKLLELQIEKQAVELAALKGGNADGVTADDAQVAQLMREKFGGEGQTYDEGGSREKD